MKIARIIISTVATALAILSSAALSQQPQTGTITGINRINGTIAIQRTQSGTVGMSAGTASEEFKLHGGVLLDALHAGDKVTFSAAETGGAISITKVQNQ